MDQTFGKYWLSYADLPNVDTLHTFIKNHMIKNHTLILSPISAEKVLVLGNSQAHGDRYVSHVLIFA